jgi:hypothetical protein
MKIKLILLLILSSMLFACTVNHKVNHEEETFFKNSTSLVIPNNSMNNSYQYQNWYLNIKDDTCYIYSFPISSYGNYTSRGLNYMLINSNKKTQKNEILVIGGAPYKKDINVRLQVDDTSYLLAVDNMLAWVGNDEEVLVKMFKKNNLDVLVFSEFADLDSKSIDKYSLLGLQEALLEMNKKCGSPV